MSQSRIPNARLAPITGSTGTSRTATIASGVLLLGAAAYLGLTAVKPLGSGPSSDSYEAPVVEGERYAPINSAEGAALADAITRANAFTPDRGSWVAYFRTPSNPDVEVAGDPSDQDEPKLIAGLVQVDDPEQLAPDVKQALTAFLLTGIYAVPDERAQAEFKAMHEAAATSFSAAPGETFEVPRTPGGIIDSWTVLAIDRATNRVVIQGLGANVPLSLFGGDVDTSPIVVDDSGAITATVTNPDPAVAEVETSAEEDAQPQPALRVERKSASDIERELRALEEEGIKVDINEIFRLMNLDESEREADERPEEESSGGTSGADQPSNDEPETSSQAG